MNINNAFPSKYLKSGDLAEGEDMVLTITSVDMENIGTGDEQEVKPIVYFEETDKGFVLNKTNANTISGLHGPETDGWVGKKITLFATEVDFQGKQTLALRVRMRVPGKGVKAASQPQMGSDPVTKFWICVNESGIDNETAKAVIAENNGDFVAALAAIQPVE